jgi:hypothetical protein
MTKIYKQTTTTDVPANAQYGDIIIKSSGALQSKNSQNTMVDAYGRPLAEGAPHTFPKIQTLSFGVTSGIISSSAGNMTGVAMITAKVFQTHAILTGKSRIVTNTSPTGIFSYGLNVDNIVAGMPALQAQIALSTTPYSIPGNLGLLDAKTGGSNIGDAYAPANSECGYFTAMGFANHDGVIWGRPGRVYQNTGTFGAWNQANAFNAVGSIWSFEFCLIWNQ